MSRPGTRASRWALTFLGALGAAQGLAKWADARGYVAALARADALPPSWLSAAAAAWTALELAAGLGLLYAGLAARPERRPSLVAAGVALAVWLGYTALLLSAHLRRLALDDCTFFGAYLPQSLSLVTLAETAALLAIASRQVGKLAAWGDARVR